MDSDMIVGDIADELWREYEFGDTIYRIENPKILYCKRGSTTHRVLDMGGIIHLVPAVGHNGCVIRYAVREGKDPVRF